MMSKVYVVLVVLAAVVCCAYAACPAPGEQICLHQPMAGIGDIPMDYYCKLNNGKFRFHARMGDICWKLLSGTYKEAAGSYKFDITSCSINGPSSQSCNCNKPDQLSAVSVNCSDWTFWFSNQQLIDMQPVTCDNTGQAVRGIF
eukprot:TRINITY_DN10918_c0_g1_i1.p1 TRINITY_DN10918_c0_g1~~TRINITY_DN10918_c0_g1_i1.p1  ORF type:complete len:144 (-),score=11.48 TRINITY_DN10918_c0_g1_i1:166-597(-)